MNEMPIARDTRTAWLDDRKIRYRGYVYKTRGFVVDEIHVGHKVKTANGLPSIRWVKVGLHTPLGGDCMRVLRFVDRQREEDFKAFVERRKGQNP